MKHQFVRILGDEFDVKQHVLWRGNDCDVISHSYYLILINFQRGLIDKHCGCRKCLASSNDKNDSNKKNSHIDKLFTNNKNNSLVVESQESLRSSLLLSPNPSHRLSLPRRYSSNNSSNSSLGEDITYTEQERLKKKSTMKRRNGLALRKVSAMTSPEAIRGAEMKLLRVFACMLVCSSWWVMYLYSSTWWSGWSTLAVFQRTRTLCSTSCIQLEVQLSRWLLC